MRSIEETILNRAEKLFLAGKNEFAARGGVALLALALTPQPRLGEIKANTNVIIAAMLEGHGAEGAVYCIEDTNGGAESFGKQDRVLVTERDGELTHARPALLQTGYITEDYVPRTWTPNYKPVPFSTKR